MPSHAFSLEAAGPHGDPGARSRARLPTLDTALVVAAMAGFSVAAASILALPDRGGLADFFLSTDRLWLIGGAVGLLFARLSLAASSTLLQGARKVIPGPGVAVALAAVGVFVASIAIGCLMFRGYGLSRDEAMADFDAAVLRSGHLIAPVAPQWRSYVPALLPEFRLYVADNAGWVSQYLPMNAALRAVVGIVIDPIVLNPLLAAVSVVAVAGVARRLWPGRPEAALIAALLLASSSQLLIAAGTPYAMTGHLALNMTWLWLFLSGRRLGHLGALLIAFVATGLHQLVFHPLFAAPFIVRLWVTRRWALATTYTAAYLAIGLFWLASSQLMFGAEGLTQGEAVGLHSASMLTRFATLLQDFSWSGLDLMAKNLVRFAAWQNPLVVPLAIVALVTARRAGGSHGCLAWGIGLTTLAMLLLMPKQGHGWGYRYLHGFLGSVCLMATAGWMCLADRFHEAKGRAPWSALALPTTVALLVMLPGRLIEAEAFAAPYRNGYEAIARMKADVVLADVDAVPFANDVIRNDPYLRNRPLIMRLPALSHAQIDDLCRRFRVTLFDGEQARRSGFIMPAGAPSTSASPFVGTACAPRPPPVLPQASSWPVH